MSEMKNSAGYELDWDSPIENDSPDFVVLPAGDYDFLVTNCERGRHTPKDGGKLPSCNKATIHIKIESEEGTATIKHNLFLHSSVEGLLCAFFTSIGARKRGEKIVMDWGSVIFSTGRAKVGIRKWKDDNGQEHSANEILRFYPKDDQTAQSASPKPFKPGAF